MERLGLQLGEIKIGGIGGDKNQLGVFCGAGLTKLLCHTMFLYMVKRGETSGKFVRGAGRSESKIWKRERSRNRTQTGPVARVGRSEADLEREREFERRTLRLSRGTQEEFREDARPKGGYIAPSQTETLKYKPARTKDQDDEDERGPRAVSTLGRGP